MHKLEKVLVSPDGGDGWKVEILDEKGKACFVHYESTAKAASDYGIRQGTLYQLTVDIQK